MEFAQARLLLCVLQTHLKDDGTLIFANLLRLVRLHWAIENLHHWTLDVVFEEDHRQPCLHSRSSLEVTAWLRLLAYNLLSAWRAAAPQGPAAGGLGSRLRNAA